MTAPYVNHRCIDGVPAFDTLSLNRYARGSRTVGAEVGRTVGDFLSIVNKNISKSVLRRVVTGAGWGEEATLFPELKLEFREFRSASNIQAALLTWLGRRACAFR